MPTIDIPDDRYAQLTEQAAAAGFEDVGEYLQSLADDAAFDPRCGMSDEEIAASAAECDAIVDRMKREGGGRPAQEAWAELGEKMGFKPNQ